MTRRTDTVEFPVVGPRTRLAEFWQELDPHAVSFVLGMLFAVLTLVGGSWLLTAAVAR